jgi:hypothetical protein
MGLLQILFQDAHEARQRVVLARGDHLRWLEEQFKLPRQTPEGYERLRIELSMREAGLRMLNEDHEQQYARYMQAQIASNERWSKILVGINVAVAILMLGATLAMAIATVGIWQSAPARSLPAKCP